MCGRGLGRSCLCSTPCNPPPCLLAFKPLPLPCLHCDPPLRVCCSPPALCPSNLLSLPQTDVPPLCPAPQPSPPWHPTRCPRAGTATLATSTGRRPVSPAACCSFRQLQTGAGAFHARPGRREALAAAAFLRRVGSAVGVDCRTAVLARSALQTWRAPRGPPSRASPMPRATPRSTACGAPPRRGGPSCSAACVDSGRAVQTCRAWCRRLCCAARACSVPMLGQAVVPLGV